MAIDGGKMLGCVNDGGRAGIELGPEGGARFIAGPDGPSGIEDGGTGGGRSENIWAETGLGTSSASASKSAGKSRPPPPSAPMPLPRKIMAMLFTENAANSSLQNGAKGPAWLEPDQYPMSRASDAGPASEPGKGNTA